MLKILPGLIAALAFTAMGAQPAIAHADEGSFQSPSGNIYCLLFTQSDGSNRADCQVQEHTYSPPPAGDCRLGGWGSQLSLVQGKPVEFVCQGGMLAVPPMPTVQFGQPRSVGAITCESEPTGMTCTDNSTGHFFRVSRDSYQFG
jgi:hypothetical protein